jgi:hypothetical protein
MKLHNLIHEYGETTTMSGFGLRITFWGTWLFAVGCEEDLRSGKHTTMISIFDHIFFFTKESEG